MMIRDIWFQFNFFLLSVPAWASVSRIIHAEDNLLKCGPYRAAQAYLLPNIQQTHRNPHILATPHGVGADCHTAVVSPPRIFLPPVHNYLIALFKKAQMSNLDGREVWGRMDCMYMVGWVTSLFTRNYHSIVDRLYPQDKINCLKFKITKINK